MTMSLAQMANPEVFTKVVAQLYYDSPWIAERSLVRQQGAPFESITGVDEALWQLVCEASKGEKLWLLNAYPDLAGKAAVAGVLSAESFEEQRRAGLSHLTTDEMSRFTEMNTAYRAKFGFPFILAVRNANKRTILGSFEQRLNNSEADELATALAQIHKIAWMRLRVAVAPSPIGRLRCRFLDLERRCPASSMRVELRYCGGCHHSEDFTPIALGEFVVDGQGQLASPVLQGAGMAEGTYECKLSLGEYYAMNGVPLATKPLLEEVPIRFGIDNLESCYEVTVLCRPSSTKMLVQVEPAQQPPSQRVVAMGQPSAMPVARL